MFVFSYIRRMQIFHCSEALDPWISLDEAKFGKIL